MTLTNLFAGTRHTLACVLPALAMLLVPCTLQAQGQSQYKHPVHRVAKANPDSSPRAEAHPLDPALKRARDGLIAFRQNVRDYKCYLIFKLILGKN